MPLPSRCSVYTNEPSREHRVDHPHPGSSGLGLHTGFPRRKHQLISDEGINFLQGKLESLNGRTPTIEEKKAILSHLQKLPGCEFYKLFDINSWFAANSQRGFIPSRPGYIYKDNSFKEHPTLTLYVRSQINQLLDLEQATNPDGPLPLAKVRLWGTMLSPAGVDPQEVEKWAGKMWVLRKWDAQERARNIKRAESTTAPAENAPGNASDRHENDGRELPGEAPSGSLPTPPGTATTPDYTWPRSPASPNTTTSSQATSSHIEQQPMIKQLPSPLYTPTSPRTKSARFGEQRDDANRCYLEAAPRNSPPSSVSRSTLAMREAASASPAAHTNLSSWFPGIVPLARSERHENIEKTEQDEESKRKIRSEPKTLLYDCPSPTPQAMVQTPPLHNLIGRGLVEFEHDPSALEENSFPKTAAGFNECFSQFEVWLEKLDQALSI